jgi:outer membrane protein assembly factor BamE (lipoprotein component of BamABCDE complex)
MNSTPSRLHLLTALAFCALALGGCQNRGLTKANVDQVTEGMARKQVESILGIPTLVNTRDFVVMKKTVYIYMQGKDTVTITFREDKVESKETTLTD